MRKLVAALAFTVATYCAFAQNAPSDGARLAEARAKYDDPFARGLRSFDCAIDFDWAQHWTETLRVGDEGTDAEIAEFVQPIRNRVLVTQTDAVMSSGMTEEQTQKKLPHGGMAEGLLQHAVRFSLRTWLTASDNALLPKPGTPVCFTPSPEGYLLQAKIENVDAIMVLDRDFALRSMSPEGSNPDRHEFVFHPGPQGFNLASWTMGENGNFSPGNHLIFTYRYQTVGGFQLPQRMFVNRESHQEVWRYSLSDCKVNLDK